MQKNSPQNKTATSLTYAEMAEAFSEMGQPSFRAKQVFTWLNRDACQSFLSMTNLPNPLRQGLAKKWQIDRAELLQRQISQIDGTVKLLLQFLDKSQVETVLMQYSHGHSVCVSSQVGCKMGCRFCASSACGFARNLTAGEMVAQLAAASCQAGKNVGNVVLMGIGEPLENFENVVDFISIITHPAGLNLAGRSISLSTCGLVPEIYRLANLNLSLTLSISLHATTNSLRDELMPINKKWPLEQLLPACKDYRKKTGRRVSFEYAMLDGINDQKEDAKRLVAMLLGTDAHVNLIFANQVQGTPFAASSPKKVQDFKARLEKAGVQVTVRRRLGADIDAACGQLRAKEILQKTK